MRNMENNRKWASIWREKNRDSIRNKENNRYNTDPEFRKSRIENSKKYRLKNKDKLQKYRDVNKPKLKQMWKNYREKNKIKRNEYNKKYWRDNPEKHLKYNQKYYSLGIEFFNLNQLQYRSALLNWSRVVRKRDNNKCKVCGSKEKLQAHHILYKQFYPKLALNVNNGITLCVKHHNEVHGKGLS